MYSTHTTRVITTRKDLRAAVQVVHQQQMSVGLVPTMGALHEGHLSLVRAAQQANDFVVVTIFVNPRQFGPHEDLEHYPRTLSHDVAALDEMGVDVVFVPAVDEIYPPGFSTYVDPPAVSLSWEGQHRPGHFRGVTTVVLKLFQLSSAETAFFGAKDYQQVVVIRQMAEDLNLPITVHVLPIVRDSDGLALSSRNRYLSTAERKQATTLYQSLQMAERLVHSGQRSGTVVQQQVQQALEAAGITKIDYVAVVDPSTLQSVREIRSAAQLLIAAYVGDTRLIDNRRLEV